MSYVLYIINKIIVTDSFSGLCSSLVYLCYFSYCNFLKRSLYRLANFLNFVECPLAFLFHMNTWTSLCSLNKSWQLQGFDWHWIRFVWHLEDYISYIYIRYIYIYILSCLFHSCRWSLYSFFNSSLLSFNSILYTSPFTGLTLFLSRNLVIFLYHYVF